MNHEKGRVWSPVITPFNAALAPDVTRFVAHCRWLLQNDVGLALFGTNSEANSLSVQEKKVLLDALIKDGIPAQSMLPGTGSCAIPDAVDLTRYAVDKGVEGVLMLPPFYYKGVSDEGLFRYFAEVIERVGDANLRIYLYHIPPLSQVPISLGLIDRLLKAYPNNIVGVKDSSGDWDNTKAMIDAFGAEGFQVYAGSETFLLDTLRAGGAGCISATANVNPDPIATLARTWKEENSDQQQDSLLRTRRIFEDFPMIPALKAVTARFSGAHSWGKPRPPLVALTIEQRDELFALLDEVGFDMPGVPGKA